jgi:hypothetical protein
VKSLCACPTEIVQASISLCSLCQPGADRVSLFLTLPESQRQAGTKTTKIFTKGLPDGKAGTDNYHIYGENITGDNSLK